MIKNLKRFLSIVMVLTMVMTMSGGAFAGTDQWTSYQGNNQNNGVVAGDYSQQPEWKNVELLDGREATGFSGIDSQPLMTTENGTTFAYVVTDSVNGPRAFKVNCDENNVEPGWEGGVPLSDVSNSQLGTGTIVDDTWYLPVTYDSQTIENPYFIQSAGEWNIESPRAKYEYAEDYISGIKFTAKKDGAWGAYLTSSVTKQTQTIDAGKEDVWANFRVQFGETAQEAMKGYRHVRAWIVSEEDGKEIEIGLIQSDDIYLGKEVSYSINCTKMLQKAGMSGEKTYKLKLHVYTHQAGKGSVIYIREAGINKNNMYLKSIENISTTVEPTAKTLVDFHEYHGQLPGGRGGQLNTPILSTGGKLYFGNWIRGDESGRSESKYYEYDIEHGSLKALDTKRSDDGFYLAGAVAIKGEKGDYIAFGSMNGYLYLFDTVAGEKVSEAYVGNPIKSSVCYGEGGIFVATKSEENGSVSKYVLNSDNQLTLEWSKATKAPITTTPVVSDGLVYVAAGNMYSPEVGQILALNCSDGEISSVTETPRGTASGSLLIHKAEGKDAMVYYTTNNGSGAAYLQHVGAQDKPCEIGQPSYAVQGFAAANGYVVYGNDGVYDPSCGNSTVSLYIAK